MKIIALLLLVSIGLMAPIYSQTELEWFPIGAEWIYSSNDSGPNRGFFSITVIGDTTLAGRKGRIIYSPVASNENHELYVTTEGQDSVYIYSEVRKEWLFLYDFSANVGDTVVTFLTTQDERTLKVVIDSVSTTIIGLDTFEVQYFSTDLGVDWFGPNIKYIGNEFFLVPQFFLSPPPQGPLRCYFPDEKTIYSIVGFACDAVPAKALPPTRYAQFEVAPNPVVDNLNIKLNNKPVSSGIIFLFDLNGRVLQDGTITESGYDVSSLPTGIYAGLIWLNSNKKYSFMFKKK